MVARFQVVSLPVQRAGEATAGEPAPRRRFTWRFLAANNRSLAAAVEWYPDAASCIASVHDYKRGLVSAECEFVRDEKGLWTWTVRVGESAAYSSHRYPRRLRARMTCESFFLLAADSAALENMNVVYL